MSTQEILNLRPALEIERRYRQTDETLSVIRNQMVRTAPQYFNTHTPEGRAALLAASVIASANFADDFFIEVPKGTFGNDSPTTVLELVTQTRGSEDLDSVLNLLYTHNGVRGGDLRGFAQLHIDIDRENISPHEYNTRLGCILYGEDHKC